MNKTINQLPEKTSLEPNDELILFDNNKQVSKKIKGSNVKIPFQYSTEEQFTGKYWYNGKPIYSKICLQSTTSGSINSKQWTRVDDKFNCPNNVEIITNSSIHVNTSFLSYWLFDVYQNTIRVYNYEDTTQMNNDIFLCLEYTKTTDSPLRILPNEDSR